MNARLAVPALAQEDHSETGAGVSEMRAASFRDGSGTVAAHATWWGGGC